MMRGTASALEAHHRVQVLDEAIVAAVKLSKRYVPIDSCPINRSACSTPPARASR